MVKIDHVIDYSEMVWIERWRHAVKNLKLSKRTGRKTGKKIWTKKKTTLYINLKHMCLWLSSRLSLRRNIIFKVLQMLKILKKSWMQQNFKLNSMIRKDRILWEKWILTERWFWSILKKLFLIPSFFRKILFFSLSVYSFAHTYI